MKRPVIVALFCLALLALIGLSSGQETIRERLEKKQLPATNDEARNIDVHGLSRSYLIHVPTSYKKDKAVPLVLVFHGGGGDADGMVRYSHFDALADREGFIAIYPDGTLKQWNDGRLMAPKSDDVGFVRAIIDEVEKTYKIDRKRIYATGMSNGAMMSQRLACEMSGTLAAVAPVAGTMPDDFAPRCSPTEPISVLMIHGTDDPLVPYNGGSITLGQRAIGGKVWSAADTIKYWAKSDKCGEKPTTSMLPDAAPQDGTRISHDVYSGCAADTEVALLTVNGGGHTWPSGIQYLPERFIGKTSKDIDATETIWDFFAKHPMK
jgi:polyhydroxybutyrate depolymerase